MSEAGKALVPSKGSHPAQRDPIDLVEDPLAREFLVHYRTTKRLSKAAEAVGIANTTYRRWLGKHSKTGNHGYERKPIPGFVEAFEEIHEAVLIDLEDEAQRMAFEGVEEINYKVDKETGEETIRNRRIRQDPALVKAVLGGKMPEKYGRGESANQVNIVVVRTDE